MHDCETGARGCVEILKPPKGWRGRVRGSIKRRQRRTGMCPDGVKELPPRVPAPKPPEHGIKHEPSNTSSHDKRIGSTRGPNQWELTTNRPVHSNNQEGCRGAATVAQRHACRKIATSRKPEGLVKRSHSRSDSSSWGYHSPVSKRRKSTPQAKRDLSPT
jgi:hypothetical protein